MVKAPFIALTICAALALSAVTAAQDMDMGQALGLPVPNFDKMPDKAMGAKKDQYDHSGVYNKPMYNPETKSYFENFSATGGIYDLEHRYNWNAAKRIAASRVFKGVRGRLAIVKTKETNDFIIKNLKPEDGTWIGLQYRCDLQTLRWVNGDFWPLTGYAYWNTPWNAAGTTWKTTERSQCLSSAQWMGVHYWGRENGHHWNANGPGKEFWLMIVEYPTGKP